MGVFIALLVIISWASHLAYMLLLQPVNLLDVWFWVHMLIQTWLFTGLFITAHDSMHGTISGNRKLNNVIGFQPLCFLPECGIRCLSKSTKCTT